MRKRWDCFDDCPAQIHCRRDDGKVRVLISGSNIPKHGALLDTLLPLALIKRESSSKSRSLAAHADPYRTGRRRLRALPMRAVTAASDFHILFLE
jgi:hypothetical protein